MNKFNAPVLTPRDDASNYEAAELITLQPPKAKVVFKSESLSDGAEREVKTADSIYVSGSIPTPIIRDGQTNDTAYKMTNHLEPFPELDEVLIRQFVRFDHVTEFVPAKILAVEKRLGELEYTVKLSGSGNLIRKVLRNELKLKKPQKIKGIDAVVQVELAVSDEDRPVVARLRAFLPSITSGVTAIFRCPLDGWYYECRVTKDNLDFSYVITDVNGCEETVWREDIIVTAGSSWSGIDTNSKVLVKHPAYPDSYCPGLVVKVEDWQFVVKLIDGTITTVKDGDYITKMYPSKYRIDVASITRLAIEWIGTTVIARHDSTGEYHLGTVNCLVNGSLTEYLIDWDTSSDDDTRSQVESIHMFGTNSPLRELVNGTYVLAPVDLTHVEDSHSICYLPGQIIDVGVDNIEVEFHQHIREERLSVSKMECFSISKHYYYEAMVFYVNNHLEEE